MSSEGTWITGWATSYADPADKRRYESAVRVARAKGMDQTQAEAAGRQVGDPGIGWLGNDVTDIATPWVAIPPDYWRPKFHQKRQAHKQLVEVEINGVIRLCVLGDTMPWMRNIVNGAVIDLAPGASRLWGLRAPHRVKASWRWCPPL